MSCRICDDKSNNIHVRYPTQIILQKGGYLTPYQSDIRCTLIYKRSDIWPHVRRISNTYTNKKDKYWRHLSLAVWHDHRNRRKACRIYDHINVEYPSHIPTKKRKNDIIFHWWYGIPIGYRGKGRQITDHDRELKKKSYLYVDFAT